MIRVEKQEEDSTEIFQLAADEWKALFRRSRCGPFLSWEWMSTWFKHFGNQSSPVLLKAYRNGSLIGILPMMRTEESFMGRHSTRLSLIGADVGGADQLDIISMGYDQDDVVSAIAKFIIEQEEFDSIGFEGLSANSITINIVKRLNDALGRKPRTYSIAPAATCPQIVLSAGWNSVLNKSKRASNFKRRLKKLECRPDFEFRSVIDRFGIEAAFERFLELHERRWEECGGSELTGHPRLELFQRDVVKQMAAAGLVRFDEIWLDGECRASVYGLDDGKTFYYYNSGYDLDYSHMSIGLVLIGLSVKSAIERGNTLYDFLRGNEGYKYDWANRSLETVNLSLRPSSRLLTMAEKLDEIGKAGKRLAKTALPKALSASMANRLRARKRILQMSTK